MHITLRTAKGDLLMATDALESHGHALTIGNNFSLAISAESEAETLFKGLSAGGQVTMALEKTFWNAYFGMCTDRLAFNGW